VNTSRLRNLEKRLRTVAEDEGGLLLTMHPDGSGTDDATGKTYTAAEIAERERTGKGWLVCIQEQIVEARQ
jgi:hypothetical protein